jgi:hypothetical protein
MFHIEPAHARPLMHASWLSLNRSLAAEKLQKYMKQLLSITPLEVILLVLAAVGIFLFFRACWRNIQRSQQD